MLARTVIIPLGLVLDLNHSSTVVAFSKLAASQGKSFDIKKVMPQVLEEDNKFKAGCCSSAEFRENVLNILGITASDEQFDQAWNAMLGDLTNLPVKLREIEQQYKHLNIIWVSKTNPIHLEAHKQSGVMDSILRLNDNFFVSYRSIAVQYAPSERTDVGLYHELATTKNLLEGVSLILQLDSQSPFSDIKKRDSERAQLIKEWGLALRFRIIERGPTQTISDIMSENFSKYFRLTLDMRPGERNDFFLLFKNPTEKNTTGAEEKVFISSPASTNLSS